MKPIKGIKAAGIPALLKVFLALVSNLQAIFPWSTQAAQADDLSRVQILYGFELLICESIFTCFLSS
jgi:hypothetical protein